MALKKDPCVVDSAAVNSYVVQFLCLRADSNMGRLSQKQQVEQQMLKKGIS